MYGYFCNFEKKLLMALHIDLGSNVVAGWTNQIALSVNGGVSWNTFAIGEVKSVSQRRIVDGHNPFNSGNPQVTHERIRIKMGDCDIDFDVKDVANQPTWSVGGVAGLNAAVSDIATWIG